MSVQIDPATVLGFNRPLTQHVKRALHITNKNAQPVAFKVKTTAPKLYCVRPNSGRVEPGETVEVQVMLQAMKEEPPLNAKCKDKFLIQSTLISPEKETLSLQDMWNAESPDDISSQKIRVVYLPPEGQTVPEEDEGAPGNVSSFINASDSQFDTVHPIPYNGHVGQQPIPDFEPPSQQPPHGEERGAPVPEVLSRQAEPSVHEYPSVIEPRPPVPAPAPVAQEERHEEPQHEAEEEQPALVHVKVHTPQPHTPPPPAPVPVVVDPNPELVAKLKDAQAEIERLRNLISSMPEPSSIPTTTIDETGSTVTPTELRRRTRALSDDGSSTWDGQTEIGSYVDEGVLQGPPEGVPLQVVIIIALAVFVTTYLFF
ncbi:unnamed protein product [Somion occarium]|uniref:MSP domain-containing protein n=1 Tax=Somion occarium TaxID=3059160 RepID=A0ABP1E0I0_9APHY